MFLIDEYRRVYDSQTHIHAITEDKTDWTKPGGKQVRRTQKRD